MVRKGLVVGFRSGVRRRGGFDPEDEYVAYLRRGNRRRRRCLVTTAVLASRALIAMSIFGR